MYLENTVSRKPVTLTQSHITNYVELVHYVDLGLGNINAKLSLSELSLFDYPLFSELS